MAKETSRIGLIGYKVGMTVIFTENGEMVPVTLIKLPVNTVLKVENFFHRHDDVRAGNKSNILPVSDKSTVVTVAMGSPKHPKKPIIGIAKKAGLEPFTHSKSFRIKSKDAGNSGYNVGDKFDVTHFIVGQFIDVSSRSIGKGFAGSMKRHNFKGLEASHGVSISHRAHGSTGQRQDPGKVFKGKKMAGHMGATKITVQNLRIFDCDIDLNLIAVKGCVPGAKNSVVLLRDACKKSHVI